MSKTRKIKTKKKVKGGYPRRSRSHATALTCTQPHITYELYADIKNLVLAIETRSSSVAELNKHLSGGEIARDR